MNRKHQNVGRQNRNTQSLPCRLPRHSSCHFEQLEGRQLRSGSAANFYTLPNAGGPVIVCQASASAGNVTVSQSGSRISISVNGVARTFRGAFSAVDILGQADDAQFVISRNVRVPANVWAYGNHDLLVTGSSRDKLMAVGGDDTLVAMGGFRNKLYAGSGYVNIWATKGNNYYSGSGTLVKHFFSSFLNTNDMSLDGATFAEPAVDPSNFSSWSNLSDQPLFLPSGPVVDEEMQGSIGDCYFLSSLSSIAMQNPQHLRDMITPLGDGTYAMQFTSTDGTAHFVRVDGNLATSSDGTLEYAQWANDNSTWAAYLEKGWTYFHSWEQGATPDYTNIDGGWGGPTFTALGGNTDFSSQSPSNSFTDAQSMVNWIGQQLDNGEAVNIGFANDIQGVLVGRHEYSAVSIVYDANGNATGMWVRNPWGVDLNSGIADPGHNDGQNDGMVYITNAQAFSDANDLASAMV